MSSVIVATDTSASTTRWTTLVSSPSTAPLEPSSQLYSHECGIFTRTSTPELLLFTIVALGSAEVPTLLLVTELPFSNAWLRGFLGAECQFFRFFVGNVRASTTDPCTAGEGDQQSECQQGTNP